MMAWTSAQVRGWATATASMTARDSLINRPSMLSVLSSRRMTNPTAEENPLSRVAQDRQACSWTRPRGGRGLNQLSVSPHKGLAGLFLVAVKTHESVHGLSTRGRIRSESKKGLSVNAPRLTVFAWG